MNRDFLLATVAGAITLFVVGGVFYGLLEDFFANEVSRAMPVWWALGLGELLYAAVLTLVLSWRGVVSGWEGFQAGAVFGALLGLGMALMGYATMDDVQTLATVGGHTLIGVVNNGSAGALIAVVLNRGGG